MKYVKLKIAVIGAALILPGAAFAQSGNEFLMNAAKGDNAEIMTGNLAKTKSGNKGVRNFASALVTDHTKAKKEVAALATSMSVNMPSDVKPDAQQAYDKLSQMEGPEFDREFVNHMVEDHRKDVADFQKQADAHDGKVSELAAKQLPILKKHLAMAQDLQKTMAASNSMQGITPPQRQ